MIINLSLVSDAWTGLKCLDKLVASNQGFVKTLLVFVFFPCWKKEKKNNEDKHDDKNKNIEIHYIHSLLGIPDNRGREFMLAFMQQYLHKKAGSVSLFITSDNYTVATIYIPGVNNFRQEINLQPDELVRVDLPINVRLSGNEHH